MNRTKLLIGIQNALNAGLDAFAFCLIKWHDAYFPEEKPLRPGYDRLVLERLDASRNLKELS